MEGWLLCLDVQAGRTAIKRQTSTVSILKYGYGDNVESPWGMFAHVY